VGRRRWQRHRFLGGAEREIHLIRLLPTCEAVRILMEPPYPDLGELRQWTLTERNVKAGACYCFSQHVLRVTIPLNRLEVRHALVCLDWGGDCRVGNSRG
jgi:hypothetical protein